MSYYTELTNHPSDSHVREACAEVDRLRAELSAEHERAEFFRKATISMEAERDKLRVGINGDPRPHVAPASDDVAELRRAGKGRE